MENNKQELIDQAINQKINLLINFEHLGGMQSSVVRPVRWTNSGELCAYSIESKRELFINPSTIHRCEIYETNSSSEKKNHNIQESGIYGESQYTSERKSQMSNTPISSPRLNRKKTQQSNGEAEISRELDDVKNNEDWQRLVSFYSDCLIHESRQKFIIDNSKHNVFFFDVSQDQLDVFIEGKAFFTFEEKTQSSAYNFVSQTKSRNNNFTLFVGYPIFISSENRLAPILIAPVSIDSSKHGKLTLNAEEYEVSYAALASFNLSEEEISAILETLSTFPVKPGRSLIQNLIEQIIEKTGELINDDLTRLTSKNNSLTPGTVTYRPCFFWADPGIVTLNLIKELKVLSKLWQNTPDILKYLVSNFPVFEYQSVPTHSQDKNIYVAPVYDNQRQAITASLSQPVTVVTGPPGTGKSQFILNLIVQAVLKGEKVLFASRNNKAVDVVMSRLLHEVKFPGAIRTGNQDQRRFAIDQIESRLRELTASDKHHEDFDDLQERYRSYHQKYLETLTTLKKARSKIGLLKSRLSEVEEIKKLLPSNILKKAEQCSFSIRDEEYAYLQAQLSTFRIEALQLKSQQDVLTTDIINSIAEDSNAIPLIMVLKNYEEQLGTFSDDLLHPGEFNDLNGIQSFLDLWFLFIDAVKQQSHLNYLQTTYRGLKLQLEKTEQSLSEKELSKARIIANGIPIADISRLRKEAEHHLTKVKEIHAKSNKFWFRFVVSIGFDSSLRDLSSRLYSFQKYLKIVPILPQVLTLKDIGKIYSVVEFLMTAIEISWINSQIEKSKNEIYDMREKWDLAIRKLPTPIAGNLKKINTPSHSLIEKTYEGFQIISEQVKNLIEETIRLKNKIQSKLDNNTDEIEFLHSFINSDPEYKFGLWVKFADSEPQTLADLLSNWRITFSLWKSKNIIDLLGTEIKKIPNEENLLVEARETGKILFDLGAKIVTLQWRRNAKKHDLTVIQQAELYVSTVKQLLQNSVSQDYRKLKTLEEQTFPSVMKLFPVWATTNLSAKSNFPLQPNTFDLVIIDEASQSDLPSALPLIYRGKRMVVVGDEMQLRHVASIFPSSENEAALKHGISLAKYSYSRFSLFDTARRSVHPKPSTILLNEHYRSDPQIFGFSKEEFYSEDLKIYTDMFRFSLPADYIKDGTGIFWFDAPGITQHPHSGSAYNEIEMQSVIELTMKLLNEFHHRKLDTLKFGIISPYREQEKRLQNWIDSQKRKDASISDRVIVGTAHKFQGDERDVIIFSPVLSEGIKDNSKKWLEETSNLLNVAVSRARITLIVVGDWKYCMTLDPRSKYRKLAEYVGRYQSRVVSNMLDLPIFKGLEIDIFGVLLDRHRKDHNRLTLQKLLLSLEHYIWWMDKNISNGVFDLILDIARHPDFKLKDIRILTSREQVWDERNPINPKLVENARRELSNKGITLQLGLLPKSKMVHDRYLYSVGWSINMPPFGGAYGEHKMVSEYTESKTKSDFFESYWKSAEKF